MISNTYPLKNERDIWYERDISFRRNTNVLLPMYLNMEHLLQKTRREIMFVTER